MRTKPTVLRAAIGIALGSFATTGQANLFAAGTTLSIDPGGFVPGCTHDTVATGGTCFSTGLASAGSRLIWSGGAYGTTILEGFDGIKLGVGQSAGTGSHSGSPLFTDTGAITKPWQFSGNAGHEFSAGSGISASTATSDPNSLDLSGSGQTLALPHPAVDGHHFLNFSNWRTTWAGIPAINLGGGSQDCGTSTDGICDADGTGTTFGDIAGTYFNGSSLAHVECFTDSAHMTPQTSCSASSFYALEYAAVVPQADPSGFSGVFLEYRLEGQVTSAIPIPATGWLLGSGLIGLIGIARRKKRRSL